MLEIYYTENENVHKKVEILLERRLGKNFKTERTENGKPYVEGNPLYFSITHSADTAMIALCDKPVGIDFESLKREKKFSHISARFTERERQCVSGKYDLFLKNWTAKEAYIKMLGGTLAHTLKRLEFYDDCLYCDGNKISGLYSAKSPAGVYSVCAEGCEKEIDTGLKII